MTNEQLDKLAAAVEWWQRALDASVMISSREMLENALTEMGLYKPVAGSTKLQEAAKQLDEEAAKRFNECDASEIARLARIGMAYEAAIKQKGSDAYDAIVPCATCRGPVPFHEIGAVTYCSEACVGVMATIANAENTKPD